MKTVIFDCDGVLVDSEIIYKKVELAALAEIGMVYEPVAFQKRFLGRGEQAFFAELEKDHQEQFRTPLPKGFPEKLMNTVKAKFEAELAAIPTIIETLATLNVPKCVASSSGTALLHRKLALTGLADYFGDHVYSADVVAHPKPAPDLFLYVAAQMETTPENCIVVEDSRNGVLAGKAAGITTIGFIGGGHCDEEHGQTLREAGADDIIADMNDLLSYL